MTTPTPAEESVSYLDEPDSARSWCIRMLKGILVGIGFILPGLSGGVLAVIFRIYDPIIRFLAKPYHRFFNQVRYFLPIGIGGCIGIVLFSVVVDAAFGRYAAQFICLFIGFVVGTFPSLFSQAGRHGRTFIHWIIMAVAAVAIFTLMVIGGQSLIDVTPNILIWAACGALIGLGVIIPGMSPSNFLIYFGLYDKMAAGIKDFQMGVIIPLIVGLAICVLLFAKAAAWAFDHYYAGMYHFILGMVIGSSVAIFPTVVFPAFSSKGLASAGLSMPVALIFALALFVIGTICSWLFSKLEDKVADQRDSIDSAIH